MLCALYLGKRRRLLLLIFISILSSPSSCGYIITETILLVTNLKSKNANHKKAFLSLRTFLKSQHLIYFAKVSKSTELLGQEFLQSCYFLNLV